MGAHVSGIGTNRIHVQGVSSLHGTTHRVQPDYIEVGSFIAAAVSTGGELIPHAGDPLVLNILKRTYARLGVNWNIDEKGTLHLPTQIGRTIKGDIGNDTPKIEDGIWPAFTST